MDWTALQGGMNRCSFRLGPIFWMLVYPLMPRTAIVVSYKDIVQTLKEQFKLERSWILKSYKIGMNKQKLEDISVTIWSG